MHCPIIVLLQPLDCRLALILLAVFLVSGVFHRRAAHCGEAWLEARADRDNGTWWGPPIIEGRKKMHLDSANWICHMFALHFCIYY
jgi:hypothetical protein